VVTDAYLWLKLAHILSATLLFGTGLGTAFQMFAAHLRRDAAAIAIVSRNTVLADWLFTATAGVLQPLTGLLMAHLAGYDLLESWLVASYALYAIAGSCWLKVVQLQYRVRRLAVAASERREPLPDAYFRAMRLWIILGWPAFASLVIVFALMVIKPTLW
jgi:uncharacterized membrane protein